MKNFFSTLIIVGFVVIATWILLAASILSLPGVWWSLFAVIAICLIGERIFYYSHNVPSRQLLWERFKDYGWIPVLGLVLAFGTSLALRGIGHRYHDFPWAYYYYLEFLIWSAVLLTVAGFVSFSFDKKLATAITNWFGHGGFWKIWSTHNSPANSFLIIYLNLLFLSFLYGLPTPTPDSSSASIGEHVKGIGNIFTLILSGEETFTQTAVAESHLPTYTKGWWLIKACIVLFPVAVFGLLMSRRDGVASKLENFLNAFRRRKDEFKAHATHASSAPATVAGTAPPVSIGAKFSQLIYSDIIAEVITEVLGGAIKFFRTK